MLPKTLLLLPFEREDRLLIISLLLLRWWPSCAWCIRSLATVDCVSRVLWKVFLIGPSSFSSCMNRRVPWWYHPCRAESYSKSKLLVLAVVAFDRALSLPPFPPRP